MENWQGAYITAIETIESSQLSAIEHLALRTFLVNAQVPKDAGEYVLQRISENPQVAEEETLRAIRADVKTLALKLNPEDDVAPELDAAVRGRENHRCCVTGWRDGVKPVYIVPPSIRQDSDLQPEGYLRPLLEVILSRDGVDQLFTFLESRDPKNELQNLWLMAPRVRKVFRGGHVRFIKSPYLEEEDSPNRNRLGEHDGWRIERIGPGAISQAWLGGNDYFYKPPTTTDPDNYPLPARFLLSIHTRVSINLHIFAVESEIQKGWPPINKGLTGPIINTIFKTLLAGSIIDPWTLGRLPRLCLRSMLLVLPRFIRVSLYKFLDRQVEYWDPEQKGSYVKYLPFGLCLKTGRATTANEANALLLVEKHTSINSPRLIDSAMIDESSGFILMTRIFGDQLDSVYYRTTYAERDQIGKDLAKWIAELRRIPNKSSYLIANTVGGPITDHRYLPETWGPYNSVGDFTKRFVRDVFGLQEEEKRQIAIFHEKKHEVCFTHGDLHLSNIFVKRGRLSGLIDFEDSGFKPEYWEFTRALWPYGGLRIPCYMYRSAFEGKYEEEWEADAVILNHSPIFV